MTTEIPQIRANSEPYRDAQVVAMAAATIAPQAPSQDDLTFDMIDPFSFNPQTLTPRPEEQQPEPEPEQSRPRQRRPRINHSIIQRALVVALKSLTDFTNKEIEAAVGVETRTVQKIYKKARDRGFDPEQRPIELEMKHVDDGERTGRPRKRPLSVEPVEGIGEGDMETQLQAQIQAQFQGDGLAIVGVTEGGAAVQTINGVPVGMTTTNGAATKDDGTKKRTKKDAPQRLKAGKKVVDGMTADTIKGMRKRATDGKPKATTKTTAKESGKVAKRDTARPTPKTKTINKRKQDAVAVANGVGREIIPGTGNELVNEGQSGPPDGPELQQGGSIEPHDLQEDPRMDDVSMSGMGDDEAFNYLLK